LDLPPDQRMTSFPVDIDFGATASLLKRIEHRAATAAPYPRNETAHATSDQPHLRAFKHDLQTVAVVSRLYPPVKSLDHPPVKGRPASWKRAWQGLFQAVLSEKDKPFVSSNAMTAMTRSLGHGHLRPLQPLLAIEFLVAISQFSRRRFKSEVQHCDKPDSNRARPAA
jgi:hypothetical protein